MQPTRRTILTASLGALAMPVLPRLSMASTETGWIELRTEPARLPLYEDVPSDLWTYNGQLPGPEIRVRRNERVRVRFTNGLDVPSTVHWHGIRIDNAMDGVPGLTQEPVPPDGTFEYDFVAPDAGTYWYHAHHRSWEQVARGLYGSLIVEDDTAVFDRDHDLTLMLDDWRLGQDGALDVASLGALHDWSHAGRLGNWLTVNGESLPSLALNAGETYRLRLINASNARVLRIDPNRFDAQVIALDGQALGAPVRVSGPVLQIGPAQRVDLLVTPKADADLQMEEMSGQEPYAFATFPVQGNGANGRSPEPLASNALPEPDRTNARRIRLDMSGGAMGNFDGIVYKGKRLEGEDFRNTRQLWAFNGVANLADAPYFSATRGETIEIEMQNDTAFPHAIHLHGHHFRVIGDAGEAAAYGEPWRDTVLIDPDKSVRIAFVADNPGKWLLHCHMLEHAAAGMRTWFEVL